MRSSNELCCYLVLLEGIRSELQQETEQPQTQAHHAIEIKHGRKLSRTEQFGDQRVLVLGLGL